MEGRYAMQERERLEVSRDNWRRLYEEAQSDCVELAEELADARKQIEEAQAGKLLAVAGWNQAKERAERAEAEVESWKHSYRLLDERREAVEQQRDEALALAETLIWVLEAIQNGDHMGCEKSGDTGECNECFIEKALSVNPPQALAQQRERMEKLEAVTERGLALADAVKDRRTMQILSERATRFFEAYGALAEFDAERGQG